MCVYTVLQLPSLLVPVIPLSHLDPDTSTHQQEDLISNLLDVKNGSNYVTSESDCRYLQDNTVLFRCMYVLCV
jgi:hypothetical protein